MWCYCFPEGDRTCSGNWKIWWTCVLVSFMYQPDWTTGFPDICLNITLSASVKVFLLIQYWNQKTEPSISPSPVSAGLIQSSEGPNRTKRLRRREFSLPLSLNLGHWFSPAFGLRLRMELTPLILLDPGPLDLAGTIPSALQNLQLADCRSLDS